MRGGFDPGRCYALACHAVSSSSFLLLLARKRQPDTGDHILAHPLRRAILDTVEASRVGVTMGELREVVRLGWGNGYHHLGKLERAGLIQKQRIGRRLVIATERAPLDEEERKARAYLRSEAASTICADIHTHPGAEVSEVVARTGLTECSVYYRLKPLGALGLVVSRSRTRQFALHTTALYEKIMAS